MKHEVTACIVHYNTPEWLKVSLRRLVRHTAEGLRIIVVDNNSPTAARRQAADTCKLYNAELIPLTARVKHGAALDIAVKKVNTPWMLSLDSDAFPIRHGWLRKLLDRATDRSAVIGASAGTAHDENPFGNFVHPCLCMVSMNFLKRTGVKFEDAWPRWDTGEQITMEALRLGWDVRYLTTTHFNVYGYGTVIEDSVFHAWYATRLVTDGPKRLAKLDGIDVERLKEEHQRVLDGENAFSESGGPDPFANCLSDSGTDPPDLSVVIPFRRRGEDTLRNLEATIKSLNTQTLGRHRYEVVLVEAAPSPDVSKNPPRGCRTVFAYCPHSLFPKSWAMNVGFRHSAGRVLVFHDADITAPPRMLELVLRKIAPGSPVVKPAYIVRDLNRAATAQIHKLGIEAIGGLSLDDQRPRNAPGGSIAMTREHFEKLKGFNQEFIGWGGEDDEFLLRVQAIGKADPPNLNCELHHLWHHQEPKDYRQVAANRRVVGHVRGLRVHVRGYIDSMPDDFGDINAFRRMARKPKKASDRLSVLLAGAYSTKGGPDANAGDDATRDMLVNTLVRRGCRVRISPRHPCSSKHFEEKTDVIVVGGGGIIADYSETAFYNYMSYLKHAAQHSIPVAFLGIGVNPLKDKRSRVSNLLRGASAVCVRDRLSAEYLEDGRFATMAADLAWMLDVSRKQDVPDLGDSLGGVFLVGNSYLESRKYAAAVDDAVDSLVKDGLTPVLVVHAKDDLRAVEPFTARHRQAKVWNYFASKQHTPAMMVALLKGMSRVVSSRYHGLIFSALAGTPCRAIPGSPEKVLFLQDDIGADRLGRREELPDVVAEMRRRAKRNISALSSVLASAREASRSVTRLAETKVSVCMITLNDGAYVRRVLASIPRNSQVGEIVAVDGGSTDETVDILKADGRVRLLFRSFPSDFSDQKNFCLNNAKYDWIVWCDPDEILPSVLWNSIDEMVGAGNEAFWFPRENFIGNTGTPTNDIATDPDYQFRFFSKKCRWVGKVHENLVGYQDEAGKRDFVIQHRKSRLRQNWNDQLYGWMLDKMDHRPQNDRRIGG